MVANLDELTPVSSTKYWCNTPSPVLHHAYMCQLQVLMQRHLEMIKFPLHNIYRWTPHYTIRTLYFSSLLGISRRREICKRRREIHKRRREIRQRRREMCSVGEKSTSVGEKCAA